MNPPPLPSKQPPLFANNFVFEPMPNTTNPISLLENLLKFPGRVVHELHQTRAAILAAWLLIFGIIGVAIYGIVVGAQSGGAQLWIAPAKLIGAEGEQDARPPPERWRAINLRSDHIGRCAKGDLLSLGRGADPLQWPNRYARDDLWQGNRGLDQRASRHGHTVL